MSHLKLHFALHTSHCNLHTPHFTLHTGLFALHTSLHTALLRLHTSHFTVRTSNFSLHRRLQPLYTEKCKVSCSGFLPKTKPRQNSCSHYNFIECIVMWCKVSHHSLTPPFIERILAWCKVSHHPLLSVLLQVKVIRNSEDCFPTSVDHWYHQKNLIGHILKQFGPSVLPDFFDSLCRSPPQKPRLRVLCLLLALLARFVMIPCAS